MGRSVVCLRYDATRNYWRDRNKLLACCHVVVFVSLWKVNAGKGVAYYDLQEPMGSDGGASSRENRFSFFEIFLNYKFELTNFTDLSPRPRISVTTLYNSIHMIINTHVKINRWKGICWGKKAHICQCYVSWFVLSRLFWFCNAGMLY